MAKKEERKDWIEHIADTVNKYYAGRQVVLWGKYGVSDDIRDKLKEEHGIDIVFYVDGDTSKIDNKKVLSPDCLEGKSSQYYVVIPLSFYQSIKDKMIGGGYQERIDYYYFSDCVVCQKDDYYEDAHGNKIIGRYRGLKFAFSGFNSLIQIGDNVCFQDTCIYVHSNSEIVIGNESCFQNSEININSFVQAKFDDEVNLNESHIVTGVYAKILVERKAKISGRKFNKSKWAISEDARLRIGSCSTFESGQLWIFKGGLLDIGKDFSIGENYRIAVDSHTSILIGEDCMFSLDVLMWSNDGHSIFDVISGENINSTYEISRKRRIDIGNHVWIGMRTTILYNTKIDNGSIVGAMSLVKGNVPGNCIVAGVPTKIIRKNVSWSRENGAENISECGDQYVNYTQ